MVYDENKKLTVINFFAGPGTGKSTVASGLFYLMKTLHVKVELVNEWIKDEGVWEQRSNLFKEQDYIFAHQHRKLRRLVNHDIDYAITDSPLLLNTFYLPKDYPTSFAPFIKEVAESYNNVNILLVRNRDVQYQNVGRFHSFEQAVDKDLEILDYLDNNKIQYNVVYVGPNTVKDCFEVVKQQIQLKNTPDECDQQQIIYNNIN